MKYKKIRLSPLGFVFLLILFCWSLYGCADENLQITLRSVSAPSAVNAEITGVPPEIQELLWDDPEEEKEKLRAILEDIDKHPDWLADTYRFRICKAEKQRLYYTKYIDADGIAIMGKSTLTDEDFLIAQDIVLRMTAKRLELREMLSVENRYVVILVPYDELGIDVPYFVCNNDRSGSSIGGPSFSISHVGYDRLAAEVGGKANHYDVLVHELSHSIHFRMRDSRYKHLGDPTFHNRLETAYQQAMQLGRWKGLYAETNVYEYWAEGVQMWFYGIGTGRQFPTYADFAAYDPLLAELLDAWFARDPFPEQPHLMFKIGGDSDEE